MVTFVTIAYVSKPSLPERSFSLLTFDLSCTQLYSGNPVLHQVCYALIQLASTLQVVKLLYSSVTKVSDKYRAQIKRVFGIGSAIFITAFGIWK